MSPKIKTVKAKSKYDLIVRFQNGETRQFDIRPYLQKGIFKELQNEAYFKKVRSFGRGVEWPHEQDLSADTLYFLGIPV